MVPNSWPYLQQEQGQPRPVGRGRDLHHSQGAGLHLPRQRGEQGEGEGWVTPWGGGGEQLWYQV